MGLTTPANEYKAAHILLVEDAADLAQTVRRELEREGYRMTYAATGESALRLVQTDEPQLVILDWMLPGMNGLDVLRQLRARSPVSVLMLTARDAEIDRVLGLEVGADDYLTKPFSMRELIARVRALLRRRELIEHAIATDRAATTSGTALQRDRLRMEPDSHGLWIDDDAVDLTRIEFALLYLLVSNPGRVFSRAYLIDTLWKVDFVEGDRSVDHTVSRMRKKLQTVGECIEAVWGVGYRWKRECPD